MAITRACDARERSLGGSWREFEVTVGYGRSLITSRNTSSAAPPTRPSSKPVRRAASSTIPVEKGVRLNPLNALDLLPSCTQDAFDIFSRHVKNGSKENLRATKASLLESTVKLIQKGGMKFRKSRFLSISHLHERH